MTPEAIDDIRRVAAALLLGEGDALTDVDQYIESDFSHFKANRTPLRDIQHLPRLRVAGGRIIVGGGGVILECQHADVPDRKYALKIPRPSLLKDMQEAPGQRDMAKTEALRTAILSHRNVATLVGLSDLEVRVPNQFIRLSLSVQLTEWMEGAQPLDEYLYGSCTSVEKLVDLLCQVMRGLEHIHSKNLIHWDMKAANCLVDGDGKTVKVTDIGNARQLQPVPGTPYSTADVAMTSRENAPHCFENQATNKTDSKRIHVPLQVGCPTLDRPELDLYMAGRMISRILGNEAERPERAGRREVFLRLLFPSRHSTEAMRFEFLSLIAGRLQASFDDALKSLSDRAYYTRGGEVAADLGKLTDEFGAANNVSELFAVNRHVLRVPVSRNTEHSKRIATLIDTWPVRRLKRHEQLGLTHHVYPGARHVRHEHIVGVIHHTLDYVRALYSDSNAPYFRLLCDAEDILSLVFASAVHDIGHVAFGHYLEECSPLFEGCRHEDYAQAILRNNRSLYAATILDHDFTDDRDGLISTAKVWLSTDAPAAIDRFLVRVAEVLRPSQPWPKDHAPDLKSRQETELAKTYVLHSVIDGALDADKFDYLKRDGHHGGLDYPFGTDDDRFLQSLTVALQAPKGDKHFRPTIAVSPKGVQSVESLLVARYQMFNVMYWHRTARAATVALNYIVHRVLEDAIRRGGQKAFEERRSRLLTELRKRTDADALDWLDGEVAGCQRGDSIRSALNRILESLRERRDLPVQIFESNFASMRHRPSHYRKFREILSWHAALQTKPPQDYCNLWNTLQSETWHRICAALPTAVSKELPPEPDAHLFIDVPLENKDQVKNLYVVVPSALPRQVTPFQVHSAMALAIQRGFRYWARRLRMFVPKRIRDIALEHMTPEELSNIAFEALHTSYKSLGSKSAAS